MSEPELIYQSFFCDHCGRENKVLVPKRKHAQKGRGADYTIRNINDSHDVVLKALDYLGATTVFKRVHIREISKRVRDMGFKYPRTTLDRALSELMNINIEAVGWYSPKKTEMTDPNPEWRNNKTAGWYLRERGINYSLHRWTWLDSKPVQITEAEMLADFMPARVVYEHGSSADRPAIMRRTE